jgi:hypothetical protein
MLYPIIFLQLRLRFQFSQAQASVLYLSLFSLVGITNSLSAEYAKSA